MYSSCHPTWLAYGNYLFCSCQQIKGYYCGDLQTKGIYNNRVYTAVTSKMHMEQQRQIMLRERQQKQAAAAAITNLSSTSSTATTSSVPTNTLAPSRASQPTTATTAPTVSTNSTTSSAAVTATAQQRQDTKRQLSLSVGLKAKSEISHGMPQ